MSRRLLKATATVGGMTMFSRVLGFVRDVLFARLFGADGGTDAFFVVFKIPNFLRRLFAEGAFQQAFVPVLSEYRETRSREELREFIDNMAGVLMAVLFLVTALGVAAAPLMILLFAPGFSGDAAQLALAEQMLRITFPYLLFISLTAFASSLLNAFGKFAIPALTPIWLNVALIGAALGLAPLMSDPMLGLAWGVFIAGVVQLFFQLPFLARLGLLPRPRFHLRHAGVIKTVKLMAPAIFGASVTQINLLLDTVIASFLIAGSVTWLYYSDRLVELPLGVFGVALATVILPRLSREFARQTQDEFNRTLDWSLRMTLLIAVPATLGLMLFGAAILATLFQYGAFDTEDTRMVSLALMAYATGLPAFLLIKVLAPGFYARQDTATPVKIGLIAVFSNIGFKIVLVLPWISLGFAAAHAGLALATALAAWVNAGLLGWALRRRGLYRPGAGWPALLLQLAGGSLAMIAFAVLALPEQARWDEWGLAWRALTLTGLLAGAAASFFLAALALGLRPSVLRRG